MFDYEIQYLNDSNIWEILENWTRPIINKNTLDETHDETQIFLSCSSLETPFKPFTRFIINITEKNESGVVVDIDTLYRVVIADEITQKTFGDEKLYDHDIRLAEASKELERYTVDNLSFTNEWAKAFQTEFGGAIFGNMRVSDGWYTDNNINTLIEYSLVYYPARFSGYNSYDSYYNLYTYYQANVPLVDTYVYKTTNQYFSPQNFVFDKKMPTNILLNNPLVVPTLTLQPLQQVNIYDYRGVSPRTSYCLIIFNTEITQIYLNTPSGRTNVTAGQIIQISEEGQYSLCYTVKVSAGFLIKETNPDKEGWYHWYDIAEKDIIFNFTCGDINPPTDKLSIFDILNKLVDVTPTRFTENANTKYSLHNSLYDRYASVEAPEMIFTNKNLWEALKEIGGVINAIPYLNVLDQNNWDIINFMPLSSEQEVANTVEEEYCNSESYYDSENYTASFDLTVDNMINPVSTKEGYINEAGYKISKTIRSEEVEISLTSMNIQTVYPIYKINSLKYINYSYTVPEIELISYVKEIALYNTLVSNNVDAGKSVALYYTQGKPNIYGLNFKVSKNIFADAFNVVAIKNIIQQAGGPSLTDDQILNGKFMVEYVPYLNARIKIFKTNAPKLNIDTSMFQNQSANVLDAKSLGRKMVANIGRIGNLGYVDSIKSYHLNKIPLKGQRSKDNYYVSTVTTEYDKNHLLSSIQYTKDYQKISDFVNIQNLQRYYEISEKQSLHRYINTNMFYVFGNPTVEVSKENGLNCAPGYPDINYLTSLFIDSGLNRKINASILTAYSEDENGDEFVCSKVYLNSNALAIGNSINIITDYQDNYGAGYQSVEYDVTEDNVTTQAYMNRAIPYSDNNGKIKRIVIQNITDSNIIYPNLNAELELNINKLAKSLPAITDLDNNIYPTGSDYLNIANQYVDESNMPTFSNVGCKQDIHTIKDSREILHFNQQHHFLTNDENVIIGNAMTEACRFIQENNMTCRLVFLKNKIDAYEFKIKNSDIISLTLPPEQDLRVYTQELIDLGSEIRSGNFGNIMSTSATSGSVYIQPNTGDLEAGQQKGYIVGLDEDANAWAIITDENDLIIGKNEFISKNYLGNENVLASRIYMSVTSEY